MAIPSAFLAFSLFCHFNLLLADPSGSNPSFSFHKFDKDPNFDSTLSLYGDAKLVGLNGSSSIQLTHSVSSSGGRVMYKKPIKLKNSNGSSAASFSTYFSFLISPDNGGDGLALVMVPAVEFNATLFVKNSPFGLSLRSTGKNRSRIVAVEYGALKDAKNGSLNDDHVGIDVGGFVSVKVRNVSSINALLKSGVRLHSWVDYEAGSKRLEVRLSQFGGGRRRKPVDPLLSYPIDLSKMWNDEEVLIGLSSSNGNSSQNCFLYSWSFQLRRFPRWMHSQPLDLNRKDSSLKPVVVVSSEKKSDCLLWVISALVLGIGCGGLGAFMAMKVCAMFGKRNPVAPEVVDPVEFDHEKVKVMVVLDNDKVIKDGKQ